MTDPTRADPGPPLPEGYKDCTDIVFDHQHDHERILYLCTDDGCSVEVFRDGDGLYFAADAASSEAVACALARAGVPTAPTDDRELRTFAEDALELASKRELELDAARKERNSLREALDFYANKENWHDWDDSGSLAWKDAGFIARLALTDPAIGEMGANDDET